MSNGAGSAAGGNSNPLTRTVSTGQDNTVQTVPFAVVSVAAGDENAKWNPSKEHLRVEYVISDENSLAKSGRIVYFVNKKKKEGEGGAPAEIVLHTQALKASEIKPAVKHKTSKWDGKITEGLDDRIGKKVTADLSPLRIRVEIWNQSTPAPGKPAGNGRTDVSGEYLSTKEASVRIDLISEAKWADNRCIPHGDPDEPKLGTTKMKIRVNMAEGTEVRISVCRIGEINDESSDELYARTPTEAERKTIKEKDDQKGLVGAKVNAKGKVLLADGSMPYVEWKNYDEHWKSQGMNNFYCFKLAFGPEGKYMAASERDFENSEKSCLHMRFTVFIHRPSGDLPEYTTYARKLHRFLRNETKYYRSYLVQGPTKTAKSWAFYFQHRYMVIIFGHAACGCYHADHPQKIGKNGKPTGEKLDPYHSGFLPDQNCCPQKVEDTKKAKAQLRADKKHYKKKFGGCGNKSGVQHSNHLGVRKNVTFWFKNLLTGDQKVMALVAYEKKGGKYKTTEGWAIPMASRVPRLFLWNGGCRSILTTNYAEPLTGNGTAYYSGWTYSPSCDYGRFCYDVIRRMIKGTKGDPAPNEYASDRLMRIYVSEASKKQRPKFHPRITNSSSLLSAMGPVVPDAPTDGIGGVLA